MIVRQPDILLFGKIPGYCFRPGSGIDQVPIFVYVCNWHIGLLMHLLVHGRKCIGRDKDFALILGSKLSNDTEAGSAVCENVSHRTNTDGALTDSLNSNSAMRRCVNVPIAVRMATIELDLPPRKENAMRNLLLPVAAILTITALAILSLSPVVSADEYGMAASSQSMDDKGMDHMAMPLGMHDMASTIETIDHKTGFMKLMSGLGEMTLHFPPPAIKDLNKGDKIKVHLSFTREEESMKDGKTMMKK
jgi:hypothetical protein